MLVGESVASPSPPLCSARNLTNTFLHRREGRDVSWNGGMGTRPGLGEKSIIDVLFLAAQIEGVCVDDLVGQFVG